MKGVGFEIQASLAMRRLSSEVTFAKLYDRKTPITAADLLNDWVVPSSMNKTSRPHVFLLIVAPNIAAIASISNMSSISHERIAIIPGPRRRARLRMESVSAFTRRYWTRSIVLRSAEGSRSADQNLQ